MKPNASGRGRRRTVLFSALILLTAWPACAQLTITVTGSDWTVSASTADLTPPGAGLNFAPSYREWTTSDAQINITGTSGASTWNVSAGVRVPSGQSWPAGVTVSVIRTNDGSCTGQCQNAEIIGGTSYVGPLPTEPTEIAFFNGKRNRVNVPIMLRIDGLTASIAAGAYQIEVVYTLN